MKQAIAMAVVIALAGTTWADNDKEKAEVLFKQGKKLMGEKRYADACQAFEDSFKLDPGIGVELNAAKCFEEWGKLARAYRAYTKAHEMAKQASDKRAGKIKQLEDELDSSVPRLTIKLPAGVDADSVQVTIDGVAIEKKVFGKAQLVDPGPHVIEYQGDGGTKKSKIVPVERGGSSEITLDVAAVVKKGGGEGEGESGNGSGSDSGSGSGSGTSNGTSNGSGSGGGDETPVVTTTDPGKQQRFIAYGVAGAGVVAIGVSGILTLSARSKYNDALKAHCMDMTDECDMTGLSETHDARHEANIATIVFVAGAAAVAGGVVIYLLAPHPRRTEEHATLYVAPSTSGFVLGGRF